MTHLNSVTEDGRPLIPCLNDSGETKPNKHRITCNLVAGHTGPHQWVSSHDFKILKEWPRVP